MSESGKVYPSKRDAWLMTIIVIAVVMMAYNGFSLVIMDDPERPGVVFIGLFSMLAAFFTAWIALQTRYILRRDELIVQSGPIRWRLKLDRIERVYPTRNPLSSPALSLDRLMVVLSGKPKKIMISPADKQGFLRRLRLLQPDLRPDDSTGGLVRKSALLK